MAKLRLTDQKIREIARKTYADGDPDIRVYDDARVVDVDDRTGCWVEGWLWISIGEGER